MKVRVRRPYYQFMKLGINLDAVGGHERLSELLRSKLEVSPEEDFRWSYSFREDELSVEVDRPPAVMQQAVSDLGEVVGQDA